MTARTLSPFEEKLLEQLEGYRRELPGPAVRPPAPTRKRRLGVAAIALGLAVAAGLTLGLRDASRSQPARAATLAEVTRRTQSALTDARRLIVHATIRSSNGTVTQSWEDGERNRRLDETRLHGKLVTAMLLVQGSGRPRWTIVSYRQRAWTTIEPGVRVSPYAGGPDELRDELRRRQIALLGPRQLRGRDTLLLTRLVPGTKNPSDPVHVGPTRLEIWVDPATYLPVRRETRGSIDGTRTHTVTDFEWLPRTQANVEHTKLTIPPGFRHFGDASFSPTGTVTLTPAKRG
jgi:hypothetical protein